VRQMDVDGCPLGIEVRLMGIDGRPLGIELSRIGFWWCRMGRGFN